ncbi:MAG: MFS transporter [Ignavibacteriaceae bacterium]|jgi:EmrB/QacA subfamily drug resistance transporter
MDKKQRNKILTVLFIGVLMAALDIAIVGPALPAIQKQFAIDERSVSWIFAVYVLFNLIGTPLMAKLSDVISRRKIYILDVTLFALGSLVVALSSNFSILLAGRAVQGFGAGGIFPVASAVIGDTFPEENRGSALGLIGAVFGIAFIIGPAIAGVLLLLNWHWLFIINVPIAAVVIYLSLSTIPDTAGQRNNKFDWKGMSLLIIILSSLAYGLNRINSAKLFESFSSPAVFPFFIISIVLIPFFVINENKINDPVLRIKLLNPIQVKLTSILAIGAGLSEAAVIFIPPLLVSAFSLTASKASFMLIPVVIAMAIGSPTAGRMLDKFGSKVVLITGTTLLAAGIFGLTFKSMNITAFYIAASLIGLGMGFLVGAPLRYIMLREAKQSERGSAQGMLTIFTGIGQLFGGVFVGALASSQGGGVTGLRNAYFWVGIIILFLILISFRLKSHQRELQKTGG